MMKVMRWPLRASVSKRFHVNLILHKLEGFSFNEDEAGNTKLLVDVKWKGPKRALGSPFRRSIKTERSVEQAVGEEGSTEFNQEFENVCTLTVSKDEKFQAWDVCFVVQKVVSSTQKATMSVLGAATKSLAEFAPSLGNAKLKTKFNVLGDIEGGKAEMSLCVTFNFVELRTTSNGPESIHHVVAPSISCLSRPLLLEEQGRKEKDNTKRLFGSMRKENLTKGSEKASSGDDFTSDERFSPRSEKSSPESRDFLDSDSVGTSNEDYCEDVEELNIRKSFSYGKIAEANLHVEGGFSYPLQEGEADESTADIIALFNRTSPLSIPKLMEETSSSDSDQAPAQSSMRSLLSWRKRKLSFRSPRAKGEPLLNKAYGEEGGDEIDWDRRQAGSPEEPLAVVRRLSVDKELAPLTTGSWDFGESFTVGSWERKELVSRDEQLQLCASVFSASIDQRSESAAGGSACTALVAVVADWMHRNPNVVPSRAEFDALIRDGSAEWRKLCGLKAYKDRFPDRHFDLDTVIQAGVRPLTVIPEQSFVGFFQPEVLGDFLQGAMSFDSIWDEIERLGPAIYIVSWNDHFFVLKVDQSSCFMIDTLGERLYEGCNQAYVLRFDDETLLSYCSDSKENTAEVVGSPSSDQQKVQAAASETGTVKGGTIDREHVVYKGRDACREFIKGFLAAVPLRELQNDLKKGLTGKTCLHRMLQIEFHYTEAITVPINGLRVLNKI
ncbi:hypothetical protein O6H91_01G033500 [Diphasiastrum complanatum]|uniref:Uncharacterized protein n=4 Tax=Diphasiastrum complanatum TaxID=34168 RepID=A0ACC2EPP9_DIPCM|nr:hypothetical protein O6H91_01G033500 [Diphasiastrum complanatum]KAJ7568462.1 hypothetical protein O6H91_01G033500 [Diphasiastrum complanatum]KAJ7568464.1 hypothetical protein O6H91_01G033500 [Diphasiastrum complanatum]